MGVVTPESFEQAMNVVFGEVETEEEIDARHDREIILAQADTIAAGCDLDKVPLTAVLLNGYAFARRTYVMLLVTTQFDKMVKGHTHEATERMLDIWPAAMRQTGGELNRTSLMIDADIEDAKAEAEVKLHRVLQLASGNPDPEERKNT